MKYQGILLSQDKVGIIGDDFSFSFIIMDENGDYLSDLTGWTFRGELYSLASSIPNSYLTFTTSGNKVTLSIPNSATEDLTSDIKYLLIIKGTLDGKDYTLVREGFYFKDEILD